MRNAIVAALAVLAVAGCEGSPPPAAVPAVVLGYQLDRERNRSVSLTREGVLIHKSVARPIRVELPGWIYAGAPHCPPALALGPQGEVVVTSNVIPTIWRVDAETLAVTVHPLALNSDQDKDVGFAAVTYVPQQGAYIAHSKALRSVWKIDRALKQAEKLAAADPIEEEPCATR
jgi:hypothetical protein